MGKPLDNTPDNPSDSIESRHGDGSTMTFRRVSAEQRRDALALLLTGRSGVPTAMVKSFIAFAAEQNLSVDQLWVAYDGDRAVTATLIVPGAGHTAMIFVSPILDSSTVPVAGQLIRKASLDQGARQVRLVQSLLDPSQVQEAKSLKAGGFTEMATLVYLQQELHGSTQEAVLDPSIELVTWSPEQRPLFAQAILESYEETLDCPGMLGLRHIDDIIASHMASGCFMPELWFVAKIDGQPAAVMLLNLVPQRQALELVYLGVDLSWRRQGIAKKLLSYGIGKCRRYDVSNMILAVDDSNTPAKHLYQEMGFVSHGRKLAMIFALP